MMSVADEYIDRGLNISVTMGLLNLPRCSFYRREDKTSDRVKGAGITPCLQSKKPVLMPSCVTTVML